MFAYVIYPALHRVWPLIELRKIGIGLFLTVLAFAVSTWIQQQIDQGAAPSIAWQLLAYLVLTSAEVMVSTTCLEFSYTQAPRTMKSFVMAFFMLSVAAGNVFTSAVNFFIHNKDGSSRLEGADYYLFFTFTMLLTAVLFVVVARVYRGRHLSPRGDSRSCRGERVVAWIQRRSIFAPSHSASSVAPVFHSQRHAAASC